MGLEFVSQVSDEEILALINICTKVNEGTPLADTVPQEIAYINRNAKRPGGQACISVRTKRNGDHLYDYLLTDTTMEAYFPNSDYNVYAVYSRELQAYLGDRFYPEYIEYLAQQIRNSKATKSTGLKL